MSLEGFSGSSGIKYGLNLRGVQKKGPAVAAKPKLPVANAFQVDSDDELDGLDEKASANVLIQRQQKQLQDARKTKEMYQKALEEDATVFDYDGVYDQMKQDDKKSAATAEKVRGKSRYIETLMVKAKERQREQDIIFERRVVKEREKEDHLFGDKEKFVTAAYKKKLEEDAKWLADEKKWDAAEEANDVTKRGDLSGFYSNLLNRNAAFGGKADEPVAPAAAAAKARSVSPPPRESRGGDESPSSPRGAALDEPAKAAPPPKIAAPYRGPVVGPERPPEDADGDDGAGAGRGEPGPSTGGGDAAASAVSAPKPAPAPPPAKRERAAEAEVLSAKERYLARKKAKLEGA